MFLKGGRPPPPLQTHPHTHTMREKRRYNGALRILAVFRGRASQPASQGGVGRGGGFPKPPSHPAAARRSSYVCAEWAVRVLGKTCAFQRLLPPKPVGQKFTEFLNSVAANVPRFIPLISDFLCRHIEKTTLLKAQFEQSGPHISFLEVDLNCSCSWGLVSLKQPQLKSTDRSPATPSRWLDEWAPNVPPMLRSMVPNVAKKVQHFIQ